MQRVHQCGHSSHPAVRHDTQIALVPQTQDCTAPAAFRAHVVRIAIALASCSPPRAFELLPATAAQRKEPNAQALMPCSAPTLCSGTLCSCSNLMLWCVLEEVAVCIIVVEPTNRAKNLRAKAHAKPRIPGPRRMQGHHGPRWTLTHVSSPRATNTILN